LRHLGRYVQIVAWPKRSSPAIAKPTRPSESTPPKKRKLIPKNWIARFADFYRIQEGRGKSGEKPGDSQGWIVRSWTTHGASDVPAVGRRWRWLLIYFFPGDAAE
jgi:hypothetical protein